MQIFSKNFFLNFFLLWNQIVIYFFNLGFVILQNCQVLLIVRFFLVGHCFLYILCLFNYIAWIEWIILFVVVEDTVQSVNGDDFVEVCHDIFWVTKIRYMSKKLEITWYCPVFFFLFSIGACFYCDCWKNVS